MKKILLFFTMLVTTAASYAQDDKLSAADNGRREAPSVEQITMDMINLLDLSDEQGEKLKALNEEYADVVRMPGRRGQFRRGDGPRMRPAPEGELQQAPQEGVQATPKLDGEKVKLGEGQQRPQMERRDNPQREKMRARREEYQQKLEKVLTAEQLEKLRSMRPEPRGPRGPRLRQ